MLQLYRAAHRLPTELLCACVPPRLLPLLLAGSIPSSWAGDLPGSAQVTVLPNDLCGSVPKQPKLWMVDSSGAQYPVVNSLGSCFQSNCNPTSASEAGWIVQAACHPTAAAAGPAGAASCAAAVGSAIQHVAVAKHLGPFCLLHVCC